MHDELAQIVALEHPHDEADFAVGLASLNYFKNDGDVPEARILLQVESHMFKKFYYVGQAEVLVHPSVYLGLRLVWLHQFARDNNVEIFKSAATIRSYFVRDFWQQPSFKSR